jgi:hypothetical protein
MGFGTVDPDVSGKKFLPGLTEAANSDGLLINATVLAMLAFAEDWSTPFVGSESGADWTPGIWSPTETALFQENENYSATAIPAYQRRRKRGVGA